MSTTIADRAGEKELLLMRSALCRLRLRRATLELHDSLQWRRVAGAAASVPVVRRVAFGLALAFVGLGRATRLIRIAGRVVLIAGIARSALAWARTRNPDRVLRDRATTTTPATCPMRPGGERS